MLVGKNIEESRSLLSFTPGEVLDDVVSPFYKQGIISDLQWSEPLFWRLHSWSCSFCNYLLARDHMWGQGCRSTSTSRASPLYSALSLLHRLVQCLHHSKSGQQFRPGDDFHSQSFTLAVNVECELLAMWTKFLQWLYWNEPDTPSQGELHPPQMLSYCLSDLTPSDGCVSFPSTAWLHPLFKSATPHPKGAELGPVSPAPAHPLKVVEVLLEVGVEGLRDQGLCQCERVHKVCPACSPASWLTTTWSVQSTWISMM